MSDETILAMPVIAKLRDSKTDVSNIFRDSLQYGRRSTTRGELLRHLLNARECTAQLHKRAARKFVDGLGHQIEYALHTRNVFVITHRQWGYLMSLSKQGPYGRTS